MDHDVLVAAAQALERFDPLGALKRIALLDAPEALALRGVAMAQLGDYPAARKLLARATRAFADPRARARCLAASGEVALASRDLAVASRQLLEAERALESVGDELNALFVRLQRVRCLVLLGQLTEARAAHDSLDVRRVPPRLRALAALIGADLAVRRLDAVAARTELAVARAAGRIAAIPSLSDEIERALHDLESPVAQLVSGGAAREVTLDEVATLEGLVIDACRRTVRAGRVEVSLVTRPVLLSLAVGLGRVAPAAASREALAAEAFGVRRTSESTRVRLRVEIGRLRAALSKLAKIEASGPGFALMPRRGEPVAVLLPPAEGEASAVLALLRAGESWTTSAVATAIGSSQRTVQRALSVLKEEGRVEGVGRGRSQRWVARPPEGFATTLLLVTRPEDVQGSRGE